MNRSIISGYLAADPELRKTQSGLSTVSFRVGVQRRFTNQNGVRETDFISCTAWRQTADFVAKWFRKGSFIEVEGALQCRSYDAQDGTKRYVTEIVADQVGFGGAKAGKTEAQPAANDTFTEIPDDSELPF